ncbi:MAG: hypothetical protein GY804_10025 [Alphaproteobacteria bacterium]|nr:hypothetical protein [Alphaproteobacteria bacterium]
MSTLKELQETAKERTEAVIGAWPNPPEADYHPKGQTKKLLANYQAAYKDIDEQIKEAYAKYLVGVDSGDLGYYNEMLKYERLTNLQKQIAKSYNTAAKKAGFAQMEISKTGIANEYYQDMYSVNWFSGSQGKGYFTPLNPKIMEVSVYSTPKIWKDLSAKDKGLLQPFLAKSGTLIDTLRNNRTKDLIKIQDSITQALLKGDSFTSLSKDIKHILNTSASNAVRIARTEGIRNMNAGSLANTQAAMDAGVDVGREVVEIKDDRTRSQSASINGQKQKGADPFHYPGGLKVDIIGNSGVAKYDINERGTSVDYLEDMDANTLEGINPATGKHGNANMRDFNKWMIDNGLKYTDSGRIISRGKTAF